MSQIDVDLLFEQPENNKYKPISDAFIPFASYVDSKTIITKNGEILQTIQLICSSDNANHSGAMAQSLRNAIVATLQSSLPHEYSFWIHTMRDQNKIIESIVKDVDVVSGILAANIVRHWNDNLSKLNMHDTVMYVTVLKNSMAIDFNPKKVLSYFNKSFLLYKHGVWLQASLAALNKIMTSLAQTLMQQYKVRIMQINTNAEVPYCESLSFFDKIINFRSRRFPPPIAGIFSILNASKYVFRNNGFFHVKNDKAINHATIFTIKDSYGIGSANAASLIESLENAIIWEIFHPDSNKKVLASYKRQIEVASTVDPDDDFDMIELLGLSNIRSIGEKDGIVYRHYAGIMVYSDSDVGLSKSVLNLTKTAAKMGIMLAQEDVGLERSFYSILPGNFCFIRHTHFAFIDEIASFAYSYCFDNDNIVSYINRQPILIIPTPKKKGYAFGVLQKDKDIFLCGHSNRSRTVWTNFLAHHISRSLDANIFTIETHDLSHTFALFSGGISHKIGAVAGHTDAPINPFSNLFGGSWDGEFFVKLLESVWVAGKQAPSQDISGQIKLIANTITSSTKSIGIADFVAIVEKFPIGVKLKEWFSGAGILSHLFAPNGKKSPDLPMIENYFLEEDVMLLPIFFVATMMCLLRTIFARAMASTNKTIVILHNPRTILDNGIVFDYFLYCRDILRDKLIFIFSSDVSDAFRGQSCVDVKSLLRDCNTKIHMADHSPDDVYGASLGLASAETYALQQMHQKSSFLGLINQNELMVPLSLDMRHMPDKILGILCDNYDLRAKIKSLIDSANQDSKIDWRWTFFSDSVESKEEKMQNQADDDDRKREIDAISAVADDILNAA